MIENVFKKKALFFLLLVVLIPSISFSANTEDWSCLDPSASGWTGYVCANDLNGDGVKDCSELLACSRPSFGFCERGALLRYECIRGSQPREQCSSSSCPECSAIFDQSTGGVIKEEGVITPIYQYTCSVTGQTFEDPGNCQANCGAPCECMDGGQYNSQTQTCQAVAIKQCPPNYIYDPNTGACIANHQCPPNTRYIESEGKCVGDTSQICPTGQRYNSATGKCEEDPICPDETSYNSQTKKCQAEPKCENGGRFNRDTGYCEKDPDCPTGSRINPATGMCEAEIYCPPGTTPNPATGKCEADPICTIGQLQPNGKCGVTPSCPLGTTLDETLLVCYFQPPNCPIPVAPLTSWQFNPARDKCQSNQVNGCPTGFEYNSQTQRCEMSLQCPAGTSQTGSLCWTNPVCPTNPQAPPNMIYNPDTNRCEMDAPQSCPQGTVQDQFNLCYTSVKCTTPLTYNSNTKKCEANASSSCPPGTTLSGSKCISDPNCPANSGMIYNSTTKKCEVNADPNCPAGTTHDITNGTCWNNYSCPSGMTYNTTSKKCEANVTTSCPTGTTMAGSVCWSSPICSQGVGVAFNPTTDLCQYNASQICGASCIRQYSDYAYTVSESGCNKGGVFIAGTVIERGRCSNTLPYQYAKYRAINGDDNFICDGSVYYYQDCGCNQLGGTVPSGCCGALSQVGGQCISSYHCPIVMPYNSSSKQCEGSPSTVCPSNSSLVGGTCVASQTGTCSVGTMVNGMCQYNATPNCPNYAPNAINGYCYDNTTSCPISGYTLVPSSGQCFFSRSPQCGLSNNPTYQYGSTCYRSNRDYSDYYYYSSSYGCCDGLWPTGRYCGTVYTRGRCSTSNPYQFTSYQEISGTICNPVNRLTDCGCPSFGAAPPSSCVNNHCWANSAPNGFCCGSDPLSAWLVYQSWNGLCERYVSFCSAGTYDSSIQRCRHTSVTYSCPNGGTLSGTVCRLNATCPSGFTWNSTTVRCEKTPNYYCPAGSLSGGVCRTNPTCTVGSFDSANNRCQVSSTNNCPYGTLSGTTCTYTPSCSYGTLNGSTDRCELAVTQSCPTGTLVGGVCQANPICPTGLTFNSSLNRCEKAAVYTCQYGSVLGNKCVLDPVCASGTLNTTTNKCELTPTYSCPTGNVVGTICQAEPTCDIGTFSAINNRCETTLSPYCPVGTLSGTKCVTTQNLCPSGLGLNTNTDKCEKDLECPQNATKTGALCYITGSYTCPIGTFIPQLMLCEHDPDCGQLTYNTTRKRCEVKIDCQPSTNCTCPNGGRLEQDNFCYLTLSSETKYRCSANNQDYNDYTTCYNSCGGSTCTPTYVCNLQGSPHNGENFQTQAQCIQECKAEVCGTVGKWRCPYSATEYDTQVACNSQCKETRDCIGTNYISGLTVSCQAVNPTVNLSTIGLCQSASGNTITGNSFGGTPKTMTFSVIGGEVKIAGTLLADFSIWDELYEVLGKNNQMEWNLYDRLGNLKKTEYINFSLISGISGHTKTDKLASDVLFGGISDSSGHRIEFWEQSGGLYPPWNYTLHRGNMVFTPIVSTSYSCPLSSGSACSGSPQTCTRNVPCSQVTNPTCEWNYGSCTLNNCPPNGGTCSLITISSCPTGFDQYSATECRRQATCQTTTPTNCQYEPSCPHGSEIGSSGKCEVEIKCAPGTSLSSSGTSCESRPVCPEGYEYNETLKKCLKRPDCPPNTQLNEALMKCTKDPECRQQMSFSEQNNACISQYGYLCPLGTSYNQWTKRCEVSVTCPVNGAYNPSTKQCEAPGTPNCPAGYSYVEQDKLCEHTPICPPSDWMCPLDANDPMCNNSANVKNKRYEEINARNNQYNTFATTSTRLSYNNAVVVANSYGGSLASMNDLPFIRQQYGSGAFWIQEGIAYTDVIFKINQGCYAYESLNGKIWQPRDYSHQGCSYYPDRWEKVEEGCICRKFRTENYERICSGSSYTERFLSTQEETSDMSTCKGSPLTCGAGISQQGYGKCNTTETTYEQFIVCGGNQVEKFKRVRTCIETTNVRLVTEYRDLPTQTFGIIKWNRTVCNPCVATGQFQVDDDTPNQPDPNYNNNKTCTNFKMMGGVDRRCRPSGLITIFANCCDLSGWFRSWCKNEEKELKKRRLAGTCVEVGTYCSKKVFGVCLQNKTTFCCFSSKLARIINEQGRPQIGKTWGSPKSPDCKGFTPEEFANLDFNQIDFSEFVEDTVNKADLSGTRNAEEIGKGIQDWFNRSSNPSFGNTPDTRGK